MVTSLASILTEQHALSSFIMHRFIPGLISWSMQLCLCREAPCLMDANAEMPTASVDVLAVKLEGNLNRDPISISNPVHI